MGTILASKIAADAAEVMFDTGNDRYFTDDWLLWLNAGQNEAAILKPDISVNNASVILVAGTKQSLQSTDIGLIKVTRNMGTDGATPGDAIRFVDMDQFDRLNPSWHSATAAATVEVYMYDERDPKHFYVYPPQPTSGLGYVEIITSIIPTEIPSISTAISIDDIYENILLNYILYRVYAVEAKNSQYAVNKSLQHWSQFAMALGRKDLVEKTNKPVRKI